MSGYTNDTRAVNGSPNRDRTSTISIILGVTIFVALSIGLTIRRLWLLRQYREAGRRAAWLEVVNGIGGDDGPITIAIGGRAVNVRRPTLKEIWVEPGNDNQLLSTGRQSRRPQSPSVPSWNQVKPIGLQLTTPHTVAFPSDPTNPHNPLVYGSTPNPRSPRSPMHQPPSTTVFQSYNPLLLQPKPTTTTALTTSTKSNANANETEKITNSFMSPHPVLTSILIKLPDQSCPSYTPPPPSSNRNRNRRSPSRTPSKPPPEGWIPIMELGTILEPVQLSSLTVPKKELNQWWDVTVNSGPVPVDPYAAAIAAAAVNARIAAVDVNPRGGLR